jgi:pyruvate dehydrogenase E1 component
VNAVPNSVASSNVILDDDPAAEIQEWIDAFDDMLHFAGPRRCRELLNKLQDRARSSGVEFQSVRNTPYCNTISRTDQPPYLGNLELERRIAAIVRWNALALVVRANKHSSELGGHLASFASGADLFEVGFNHFLRGDEGGQDLERTADLVFFQPHSAPGIYARAFLEGRLTEEHLDNFRREVDGKGLSSYPHPRLMPGFWQFPTGSMGLGPLMAVYQARFMRYLENRGLLPRSERKVWAYVGDGEMDEPESLAGLSLAVRENLDNLIFVVNCNLQRLDGPVRGNGSIIQELERLFSGAGWNVIKVIWGSDWDGLFASDQKGLILQRLAETVDGELQAYAANDAPFNRQRFFGKNQELRNLVSHLSDVDLDGLTRGGHDPVKIYAAFHAAKCHLGQPTVILAQTKKGYGLGRWAEGRMSAHQQKKLNQEALLSFRDRFRLPLSDADVEEARFYHPGPDSPEIRYMLECRARLGGSLPLRVRDGGKLEAPRREQFAGFTQAHENREFSTTMAFARMLTGLLKDKNLGQRVVPIVADEARTFGLESLFARVGIYSHCGQCYEPEDQTSLLNYKEARDGQLLEEGITEAGALSSWIAAGTSYSNHCVPLLPIYIYYSIFGFQRVGDLIWAAADSRARGFLIGATSGRTTLSGEGLQHQDGTSHLIASTIPSCRAYDPCFASELAVILEHGMQVMLERGEDVFYYLTLMNENYIHASLPVGAEEGVVRGMYLFRPSAIAPVGSPGVKSGLTGKGAPAPGRSRVQLLGSGTILREALAAADLLEKDWHVACDVWSVTSFTELRRSGLDADRWNRLHPTEKPQQSWIEQCLDSTSGPVIAATDYVRAVPDMIRAWIPRRFDTLGTDGFGRSDTRAALRRFFEIDSKSIAFAALSALTREGDVNKMVTSQFMSRYAYEPQSEPSWAD